MVYPSVFVVRQLRVEVEDFVTFDMLESSPALALGHGIKYRLRRAEGWVFGVESIRRGSAQELRRLPTLVVLGALHCLLQWRQRVRSLLVAEVILA